LKSNLHGKTVYDTNNVTVTFAKDHNKVIKIHDSVSSDSKEVKFRSIDACNAFKGRWEAEVTRRNNNEFLMICVFGCVGLKKRTSDEAKASVRDIFVHSASNISEDVKEKGGMRRHRKEKSNVKSSVKIETPKKGLGIPNPFSSLSMGLSKAEEPPLPSESRHDKSPSIALQETLTSTLTSSFSAPRHRIRGPDTHVVVKWGSEAGNGGEWSTDVVKDNRNPIWTGIGGGEVILHRLSANVGDNDISIEVWDEYGIVDTIMLPPTTGGGRVVHQLGTDIGAIAVEIKVPSSQEMEDGRRTRQWKLDHASATKKVLQRVEKDIVDIGKTFVSTVSPVPNNRWSKKKGDREYKIKPWLTDKAVAGRKQNVWWTKSELKQSMLEPSENFFPTSSPASMECAHAILKIEVLHCTGLPNADGGAIGTAMGKKTDCFVGLIVNENFARTSVINNCLSPIWPPFTRRGFLMPIMSTSRLIQVGVFDSDEGDLTGGLNNDFIAKTTVDLSRLRSGIEYTTEHSLHNSTTFTTKERRSKRDNGAITLRYSISYNYGSGPRDCMLHDLKSMIARGYPEPQVDLHSDSLSDHQMLRDTIHGMYRGSSYSLKTLYAMLDEVVELRVVLFVAFKGIKHIVFWSSPLHSTICLAACYKTASNPDFIPAFLCLLLVACLLSSNLYLQRSPGSLARPRTFLQSLAILTMDRDDYYPNAIVEPGDQLAAQEVADKEWGREQEEFWSMCWLAVENYKRATEEHEKLLEGIGAAEDGDDVDGESITKNRFGVLDPVGLVLSPVQSALVPVFTLLRVVKNILVCSDSNMWFILTFTLLFMAGGLALVPWGWILRLTGRVVSVLVLGPQNYFLKGAINDYLAEFLLYSNDPSRSRNSASMRSKLRAVLDVRIQQEQEARARDFKILYHGNRIARHWKFNVERFYDPPEIQGSGMAVLGKPKLKKGEATRTLMANE